MAGRYRWTRVSSSVPWGSCLLCSGAMADPADHEHLVSTGKSELTLDQLGAMQPGMARLMTEVGVRIWKCFYAGKAGNKPLARFQLKEAVGLMKTAAIVRPKYDEDLQA